MDILMGILVMVRRVPYAVLQHPFFVAVVLIGCLTILLIAEHITRKENENNG
jgi:hypothetical protein